MDHKHVKRLSEYKGHQVDAEAWGEASSWGWVCRVDGRTIGTLMTQEHLTSDAAISEAESRARVQIDVRSRRGT
jgi:hypothetical protein